MENRYILDTNVLLYDPDCLYAYPKSEIIIPLSVIDDLGQFKNNISEAGRNSRVISQFLDELRSLGSLEEGVLLSNGSRLSIYILRNATTILPSNLNSGKSSNKVLAAVLEYAQEFPEHTYLVTNDVNLRIRVSALGVQAIAFDKNREVAIEAKVGIRSEKVREEELEQLERDKSLNYSKRGLFANQNLYIHSGDETKGLLCRFDSKKNQLRSVSIFKKGIWGVKARNREQEAAFDLLMDPEVQIVILEGKAGTGKTLLALAVGLELMLSTDRYRKILVSRPIFPMGRDMGYLPGNIEQKIEPWMQPIFDNLEFLSSGQDAPNRNIPTYQRLLDKGLIEMEPLTYIRGRSIPLRFMIVDEAQNLTPHELKTIITRAGEGTKMILTGDPFQVDNPYMDSSSNGLSYVIERFRDHELAGHVTLVKGVRSKLAELASNIL